MDDLIVNEDIPVLPAHQKQSISTLSLLDRALSGGADMAQLEKFMALHERHEANEARKAFVAAMAAFKKNPPQIEKDKTVSYGQTKYNHASLANVTNKINSGLGEHGLSAGWKTVQDGKDITVTCTITHELGHSESTSLTAASDTSGQKNAIQAVGSTISYLQRYTLLALTGLASHDMDDDGKGSDLKLISDDQLNAIESLISENLSSDPGYTKRFLSYIKAESISEIPAAKYNVAISAIKTAINAKQGAKK